MRKNSDYRKLGIFLLTDSIYININKLNKVYNKKYINEVYNFEYDKYTYTTSFSSVYLYKSKEYIIIPNILNPRWFVPKNRIIIKKIGKFVKPTHIFSWIAWKITLIFNIINKIDIIYHDKIYLKKSTNKFYYIKPKFNNSEFVIFTGAKGLYQKFTIQEMSPAGDILLFHKIGYNKYSRNRIKKEYEGLKFISNSDMNTFKVPKIIDFYEIDTFLVLCLSPASTDFKNLIWDFSPFHQKALFEINNSLFTSIKKDIFINDKLNNIDKLKNHGVIESEYINNLYHACDLIKSKLKYFDDIKLVFSHGDFSPWNVLSNKYSIFIFDWEMSEYRSQLWDYFNFIYHLYILKRGFSLKNISRKFIKDQKWYCSMIDGGNFIVLHLSYVVDILSHYFFQWTIMKEENIETPRTINKVISSFLKILRILIDSVIL
ncbi:MAG: hypothetical protein M0R03_19160 [Novosphingobium sp.]|jgi:hypothetical protein|nr:hypothetical protein [Novosphingobium sp.]